MGVTHEEFHFMVECITAELIERLVVREKCSLKQAIDTVYGSDTFAALVRPETGLYFQSTGYVLHYLMREMRTGKMEWCE